MSRASKRSNVDEALFGNQQKKTTSSAGGSKKNFPTGVKTSAGFITVEELRGIRQKTEKSAQNDAVIISKHDLDRIKEHTTIKTKEALQQEKKIAEAQKQAAMAKSKAKKARMLELDEKRASKVQLTD